MAKLVPISSTITEEGYVILQDTAKSLGLPLSTLIKWAVEEHIAALTPYDMGYTMEGYKTINLYKTASTNSRPPKRSEPNIP